VALAAKRVVEGRTTASSALDALGMLVANAVKNTIARGPHIPPPLAESTVAKRKKRSDRPLSDTGRLKDAIAWIVGPRTGGGVAGL
jgi:hypothetical protein